MYKVAPAATCWSAGRPAWIASIRDAEGPEQQVLVAYLLHRSPGREEALADEAAHHGAVAADPVLAPAGGGVRTVAMPDAGVEQEDGARPDAPLLPAHLEPSLAPGDVDDLVLVEDPALAPVELVAAGVARRRVGEAGRNARLSGGGEVEAPAPVAGR